jgi:hypothetical protein
MPALKKGRRPRPCKKSLKNIPTHIMKQKTSSNIFKPHHISIEKDYEPRRSLFSKVLKGGTGLSTMKGKK